MEAKKHLTELLKKVLFIKSFQDECQLGKNTKTVDEDQTTEEDKRDENEIYGETVVSKLRIIRIEEVKQQVQRDIDSLLCEAILGQGTYGPLARRYSLESNSGDLCEMPEEATEITFQFRTNSEEIARNIYY